MRRSTQKEIAAALQNLWKREYGIKEALLPPTFSTHRFRPPFLRTKIPRGTLESGGRHLLHAPAPPDFPLRKKTRGKVGHAAGKAFSSFHSFILHLFSIQLFNCEEFLPFATTFFDKSVWPHQKNFFGKILDAKTGKIKWNTLLLIDRMALFYYINMYSLFSLWTEDAQVSRYILWNAYNLFILK